MKVSSCSNILGVSGLPGSFSEEAAQSYVKQQKQHVQLRYLVDMQGVLSALNQEHINWGIFPVVNLHGGLVRMAFEAMGAYPFCLIDELWLQVSQCLLAKPNVPLDKITHIASHPQALAQCRNYLSQQFPKIPRISCQDTAQAAEALALGKLCDTCAVIAPLACVECYQLALLAQGIEDTHPNLTAFIIVQKRQEEKS